MIAAEERAKENATKMCQGKREQQQVAVARRGHAHRWDTRRDKDCSRCGYTDHAAEDAGCPARNKTCARCGQRGHFARQCRARSDNNDDRDGYGSSGRQFHSIKTTSRDDPDTSDVDPDAFIA